MQLRQGSCNWPWVQSADTNASLGSTWIKSIPSFLCENFFSSKNCNPIQYLNYVSPHGFTFNSFSFLVLIKIFSLCLLEGYSIYLLNTFWQTSYLPTTVKYVLFHIEITQYQQKYWHCIWSLHNSFSSFAFNIYNNLMRLREWLVNRNTTGQ
jgi:hypothetical protein